jgi:probable phosphoglycerate mutase
MRIRAAAGDPIFTQMQEQQRWDVIPGGENWETLNTRLMRGLQRIHNAHPDEKVVAVVHGGVIGHVVAHATGAQPFAFNGADNGSITRIVMLGDLIKVRSFNDSTHVQPTLHDGSGQLT